MYGSIHVPIVQSRRSIAASLWAFVTVGIAFVFASLPSLSAQQTELAPTDRHVPELARYMERLQLSEPVVCRGLALYSLQLIDGQTLGGRWFTLDRAIDAGVLKVTEKGSGGSVPKVVVENGSLDAHVFIMAGEVIAGGKQTRAVRQDIVLAPGQRVDLDVFCVEQHRWQGGKEFAAANQLGVKERIVPLPDPKPIIPVPRPYR